MSGTPFISETYTVLGDNSSEVILPRQGLALVILARASWLFRTAVVEDFSLQGFFELWLVEDGPPRYDVQKLLAKCPNLRILVALQPMTPGARINAVAREIRCDQFLLVWDDQVLPEATTLARLQRLAQNTQQVAMAPELRGHGALGLPTVHVPVLERDRLKILALGADEESVSTLYPADFTALYDRRRFLATGGFDGALTNPYWQKVDWGMRSLLWGEKLTVEKAYKVDYRSQAPLEDRTPDQSYPRFYLRNLAVRHTGDHGVLPLSRYWAYARGSGRSWTHGLATFLAERDWVKTHRYRFQTEARLLTELWGTR